MRPVWQWPGPLEAVVEAVVAVVNILVDMAASLAMVAVVDTDWDTDSPAVFPDTDTHSQLQDCLVPFPWPSHCSHCSSDSGPGKSNLVCPASAVVVVVVVASTQSQPPSAAVVAVDTLLAVVELEGDPYLVS